MEGQGVKSGKKITPPTRLENFKNLGRPIPSVDLEYGHEYLEAFFWIGPSLDSPMGEIALPYSEIRAYRPDFLNEEADLLFAMSREYLSEKSKGKNIFAKCPVDKAIEAGWYGGDQDGDIDACA